jgi:hypothetical protein
METFAHLLKVQADVMAAQAKAVAVQNLPALSCYTGEDGDATDDGFDRWLESFRESHIRKLVRGDQLKLHLDKTALDVFRMLPPTERGTIGSAIQALKKCFKSGDIEEL